MRRWWKWINLCCLITISTCTNQDMPKQREKGKKKGVPSGKAGDKEGSRKGGQGGTWRGCWRATRWQQWRTYAAAMRQPPKSWRIQCKTLPKTMPMQGSLCPWLDARSHMCANAKALVECPCTIHDSMTAETHTERAKKGKEKRLKERKGSERLLKHDYG